MSDTDYKELRNKYDQFIDYNKPKALKFLQNIPFEEFTNELKSKLGIDNLNIKYEIKEYEREAKFGCSLRYKSNNLAEDSKLLSAMFRECMLESFGFEHVIAFLQDGRMFNNDIFLEEFDTFDVNQPLKFCLMVRIHFRYKNKDGGENGFESGNARYTEYYGWRFDWEERY